MTFNYELGELDSKYSVWLRGDADIFLVKFRYNEAPAQNTFSELLTDAGRINCRIEK